MTPRLLFAPLLLVLLTGLWPLGLTGWSETATAALALRTQLPV